MERIVLDTVLRAKLGDGRTRVDITDEAGHMVGHYVPHDRFVAMLDAIIPPLSREEREAAIREVRETGGVSTAEILEALAAAKRAWEARR